MRYRRSRGATPDARGESGVAAVEYGILIAAAALVMIGGMVAVGNATDAVFDAQSDGVSSPATSVIAAPGGSDETIRLDDLDREDIVTTGLQVDEQGNRWTLSFSIVSAVPLADGTVIPISGTWEARPTGGETLISEPVGSCVVEGNVCVISRFFYSRGGGQAENVDEARYVDLVINGFDFHTSDWIGP